MWRLNAIHIDSIEALEPNLSTHIKKMESIKKKGDHEVMDYVFNIIKGLPIFQEVTPSDLHKKSNQMSGMYRKDANELVFEEGGWLMSLQLYTKAIVYAEPDSESLSIAYSNRSHLLLRNNFIIQCIQDIDRALMCNPPENLKQILLNRLKKAEESMVSHYDIKHHDAPPVIEDKNKCIQSAANSIALKHDKLGYYVAATKDIKIGEVLNVEVPYAAEAESLGKYLYCDECLEICLNLIPCENCTETLYCSERCREVAYKVHKYECILLQYGLRRKELFLRMTLKAVLDYDRFTADLANKDDTLFLSGRYKEVSQIISHKTALEIEDLYSYTLKPVVFYHYLTKYTDILEILNVEHKEQVLKGLLLRNYLIAHENHVMIDVFNNNISDSSFTNFDVIGKALFPFYARFRHSCFENTFPIYYGSVLEVRAAANIKKGEQVTACFGPSYATTPSKNERQSEIFSTRFCVCKCVACSNNWPIRDALRIGTPFPKTLDRKIFNLMRRDRFDYVEANKLLQEMFKYYDSLKVTKLPTENLILFRTILTGLYLYFGNRAEVQ